jgi:hypothetical protein
MKKQTTKKAVVKKKTVVTKKVVAAKPKPLAKKVVSVKSKSTKNKEEYMTFEEFCDLLTKDRFEAEKLKNKKAVAVKSTKSKPKSKPKKK